MALRIRLQRGGATHAPHYRLVVADSRKPRDGRFVEVIGTYDPKNKNESLQHKVKLDRVEYWVSVGAQPSDTVRSIIRRAKRLAAAEPPAETAEAPAETAEAPVEKAEAPVEKAEAVEPPQAG